MVERSERYIPARVWARSRARAREARPSLDLDTIVKGAIELLDTHGLERLSMRQLGSHLNAGATSLYWHVANKDELLDLAFDEVMAELPDPPSPSPSPSPPSAEDDWRGQITLLLCELRAMMLRHPWYVRLYGRPAFGPQSMRFNANLLRVLKRAGFADALLDQALAGLSQYVVGAITNELSWNTWSSLPTAQLETMMSYIGEAIRSYPEYAEYMQGYLLTVDPAKVRESRFMTALQSLLDGLAIRLGAK